MTRPQLTHPKSSATFCSTMPQNATSSHARDVKVIEDDGFVDLDLPLVQFAHRSNGHRVVTRGTLRGRTVALLVDVEAMEPRQQDARCASRREGRCRLKTRRPRAGGSRQAQRR